MSLLVWREFPNRNRPNRLISVLVLAGFDRTFLTHCRNGCDSKAIYGRILRDDWPWMVNEGILVKNGKFLPKPKVKCEIGNYITILCVNCCLETPFPFFDENVLNLETAVDAAVEKWNKLNCQGGQNDITKKTGCN